jgi:thymidine kinase
MSITTIIGPMFSGKTSELIRLIDRKRIAGKSCLIIKHCQDNRFDNITEPNDSSFDIYHVTTHSNIRYHKCDILYLSNINDENITNHIFKKYDVVGIEEGFFFKGINYFCNKLANNNIEVIVATLESSYKQELFAEIGDLVATSENVIKLKAICMHCKKEEASFTVRTFNSNEEILIGGTDKYQSVCRSCLNNFRIKNQATMQKNSNI